MDRTLNGTDQTASRSMATLFTRTELGIYSTVSEMLKRGREERHHTIEECARELTIQRKYLQALEQSRFNELPGEMYTRAWIRKYGSHHGLDLRELMISYDKERSIRDRMIEHQYKPSVSAVHWLWDFLTVRRLSMFGAGALLIGYIIFTIYQTISPPAIALNINWS